MGFELYERVQGFGMSVTQVGQAVIDSIDPSGSQSVSGKHSPDIDGGVESFQPEMPTVINTCRRVSAASVPIRRLRIRLAHLLTDIVHCLDKVIAAIFEL